MAKSTGKQGGKAPADKTYSDDTLADMAPEDIAAYDDTQGLPSLAFAAKYYAIDAIDSLELDAAIRELDADWDGESPVAPEDFEACAEDLADTYWERIERDQQALLPERAVDADAAREKFAEDFIAALTEYSGGLVDDDEDEEEDEPDELDRDRDDEEDEEDR